MYNQDFSGFTLADPTSDVSRVILPEDLAAIKSQRVTFYTRLIYNQIKSRQQLKQVHDEVVYIRKEFPGNKTTVWDQPAKLEHLKDETGMVMDSERGTLLDQMLYPREWEAFCRGEDYIGDGTPLNSWDALTDFQVRDYEFMGLRTIEQFANVTDMQLHGLGLGARALRDKAQAFVAKNNVSKQADAVSENKALKQQVALMQDQLAQLVSMMTPQLEEVEAEPAPIAKRGRPAKIKDINVNENEDDNGNS